MRRDAIRKRIKEMEREAKQALVILKARGLVVPKKVGPHYYAYDLTDLGVTVLREIAKREEEARKIEGERA